MASVGVELPALGESVVEGTVSRWLVKEGDAVRVDQPLVEVTTDKVDAEIPSPAAGVVEKILVREGETVPVGSWPCWTSERRHRPAPAAREDAEGREAAPGSRERPPSDRLREHGRTDVPQATPVARRLAEDSQVDLGDVEGTGPRAA